MAIDPEIAVTEVDAKLNYDRTVERSLVHRAAVGEVFVTDLRTLDRGRYLAGAQLPLSHGYYSDHRLRPPLFDTLLLLESCRQASIYGAHRTLGVPVDTTMMVSNWSIELDAAACPAADRKPGELGLVDTVQARRGPRGDVRGLRFDLDLWMARRQVGRAHIEVGCTTTGQYAQLRHLQRGDDPPRTADLASQDAHGDAEPLSPELVGRFNPANVVIVDPVRDGSAISARLAPRFDNPSLFDHSYDHYPAMVLMEAARQLSLLAVDDGTGAAAQRTVAAGFTAGFERFAELDAPLYVRSTTGRDGSTDVTFEQRGETIARAAVALADSRAPATTQRQEVSG
jgi:hypothetical protein